MPTDAPSSVMSTATQSSSQNGIQSLLSEADSLIKSLYPSTSITNVAALTWPSTVVIGSQTYTTQPSSTFATSSSTSQFSSSAIASTTQNARPVQTSSATATPTASASDAMAAPDPWDRRLGIILGVVLGSIALGLAIFLVWFLHHRRKNTGSFLKKRPSTPSSDEVFSWRESANAEKMGNADAPPLLQKPMAAHGAFPSRTWTNDDDDMNPGYGRVEQEGPAELAAEHSDHESLHRTMTPEARQHRPSTPFSPAAFDEVPISPVSTSPSPYQTYHPNSTSTHTYHPVSPTHRASLSALATSIATDYPQPYQHNPFASIEDASADEDDDDEYEDPYHRGEQYQSMLTPVPEIPSRSPKRASLSGGVVYPSEDEFGRFDFGLGGERDGRVRDV